MNSEELNALKMDLKIFIFIQEVGIYHPHAQSKENTKENTKEKDRKKQENNVNNRTSMNEYR